MMKCEQLKVSALCGVIAAGVFLIDAATPLGVAEPTLYILVILVALRSPAAWLIIAVAVLCTILTVIGFFVSGDSPEVWKAIVNRALALFAIWATGLIGLHRHALLLERQRLLVEREALLSQALSQFIPICAWCKRVRNEANAWETLEEYLSARTGATFSHGICQDCRRNVTHEMLSAQQILEKSPSSRTEGAAERDAAPDRSGT